MLHTPNDEAAVRKALDQFPGTPFALLGYVFDKFDPTEQLIAQDLQRGWIDAVHPVQQIPADPSKAILDEWISDDGAIRLIHGDALAVLPTLPPGSADAMIGDPPYSSGGFTRSDRNADPCEKYVQTGVEIVRPSFSGDNRDGRSWCYWSSLWLSQCCRIVKEGGYALTFCDWRQLPLSADALQAGGFVWRGIISWNKGPSARAPHTGYFRHQCEYITWGTVGTSVAAGHGGPFPGCYDIPVKQADKFHVTGKPTELMIKLVEVVPPGGTIIDPFGGSMTTAVACALTGRKCTVIEKERAYFDIGKERLLHIFDPLRRMTKPVVPSSYKSPVFEFDQVDPQ